MQFPDHSYGFGMDEDASERENEYHDTYIGDVEAQLEQGGMDRDIFYHRSCAIDSDNEGPTELDEDGFTEREAQAFLKVVGRDH
jgi:hypothetical protein